MRKEQSSTTPECLIHKKPAFFVNTNIKGSLIQQQFPCEQCCNLYIYTNKKSQNKNRNENLLSEIKINQKQLEVLDQMLIYYEKNLFQEIQSIKNFIQQQQLLLIKLESAQQSISKNKKELNKIENDVQMIQKKLSSKFSDLSYASNIEKFQLILKLKQTQAQSDTFDSNNQQEQQEFEIIPLTSTDHDKQCQAIAFSYDSQIMIAGYQNSIKVFEFKDQKLNKIQLLDEHKKNVSYLQFMKSNKQFISCSMDGQIIFWDYKNDNDKWEFGQDINAEQCVTCIKFHSQQNMFVSSGVDCEVKFYEKSSKNRWEQFRSITCSSYVTDLSFDKAGESLLICEYNNVITVIDQVNDQQNWQLQEQINIGKKILQIQSLSNNIFAVLSQQDQNLHIYKKKKKGFMEIQQINLSFENFQDTSYHLRLVNNYSQSNNLLVCGGQQIHLLINKNNDFFVGFTYKTAAILNYVRVSEDRKFLSYWEKQSNKIHIMRIGEQH